MTKLRRLKSGLKVASRRASLFRDAKISRRRRPTFGRRPASPDFSRRRATIEDLYPVKGKAELVNGRVVRMRPTGFLEGRAGGAISASLLHYERKVGSGYALPDNVGFVVNLPRRKSFSPDAGFYVGQPTGMKFLSGAPVFAVEVRSENDYGPRAEKAIARKIAD